MNTLLLSSPVSKPDKLIDCFPISSTRIPFLHSTIYKYVCSLTFPLSTHSKSNLLMTILGVDTALPNAAESFPILWPSINTSYTSPIS